MRSSLAKSSKIAATVYAAQTGYDWYKRGREWYQSRYSETIHLPHNSDISDGLLSWIFEEQNPRSVRAFWAQDSIKYGAEPSGSLKFSYKGFNYVIDTKSDSARDPIEGFAVSEKNIIVHCPSHEARRALEPHILELAKKFRRSDSKATRAFTYEGMMGWNRLAAPLRKLDSIVLKGNEKESLVEDIVRFKASEEKYNNHGLPYHRGYLLYGLPGQGKSSLSSALASHFETDIYTLNLGSIDSDRTLTSAFSGIGSKSFVLLEDVDVFSATNREEKSKSGLTLAGLLNVLDGVTTQHGQIVLMTTNDINSLDPALIRPGRCDYKLEFTAPDADQIERFFENAFKEPLGVIPAQFDSMAQLAEVIKSTDFDPAQVRSIIEIGPKALDTL